LEKKVTVAMVGDNRALDEPIVETEAANVRLDVPS
jgi:hypothetical protein